MPNDHVDSDVKALKDNGYSTDDVGRGNKAMGKDDVAELTGSTSKEAAHAAHVARDDMESDKDSGVPESRHDK